MLSFWFMEVLVDVYPARIMQAGENYGGDLFMEGVSIYEQGCVRWFDIRFGSVEGATGAWSDEHQVWVGVRGGLLVFECDDCIINPGGYFGFLDDGEEKKEEEPEDKLCKHGVAVALAALDEGALFYELPGPEKSARPRPHPEADASLKLDRGSLLNGLQTSEFRTLVQHVLARKPELIADFEQVAATQLNDVDPAVFCHRTRTELERFRPEELPAFIDAREGEVSARYIKEDEGGYVKNDPDEVVLSYSLRPLVEDVIRRFAVGAKVGARAAALGVIQGLYAERDGKAWQDLIALDYLGEDILLGEACRIARIADTWGGKLELWDFQKTVPEWARQLSKVRADR
ncbi:hypothetical protein A9R04_06480 [Nocardiopsis dassonvillei]|uniref:hypothetical protein n=1 Tax=Nocardiopsis dassonvillei TaxID=2014 RepID=UPI0008FC431C|nr:hypothetical protein [Nocardiopsis dassonvillei]APC34356.1 hypothetical protein A9R04_06480 [Nocardiopsis dassonvillei]